MANDARKLNVVVNSNVNGALRGFSRMSSAASAMGNGVTGAFRGIATAAAVAATAITAGIGGAFKLAMESSNVNEALNRSKVVFKEAADQVIAFSETSARSYGIAQSSALQYASQFGQILGVTDMTTSEIAGMSVQLVEFAGDLASFANLSTDDALQKVFSGLAGEIEPLRREGIAMDAATISALALENGLANVNAELTQGDKIATRADFILFGDNSAKITGDFARTYEDLAQQVKVAKAEFKDFLADIGGNFVPVFGKFFQFLNSNFPKFGEQIDGFIKKAGANLQDFYTENEPQIKAAVGRIGDAWSGYRDVMGTVWGTIFDNWPLVRQTLIDGFTAIDNLISNSVIPTLKQAYNHFKDEWPRIKEVIIPLLDEIKSTFSTTVETIVIAWQKWGDDILRIASVSFGAVIVVITILLQLIQLALGVAIGLMTGDWEVFWKSMEKITGKSKDAISASLSGWASGLMTDFKNWGYEFLYNMGQGIVSAYHWIDEAIQGIPVIGAGYDLVAGAFGSETTITADDMYDYTSSQQRATLPGYDPNYDLYNSPGQPGGGNWSSLPGDIYIVGSVDQYADMDQQFQQKFGKPNVGSRPGG